MMDREKELQAEIKGLKKESDIAGKKVETFIKETIYLLNKK